MAEEFEESEIIFDIDNDNSNHKDYNMGKKSTNLKQKKGMMINSNAISIPANVDRAMLVKLVESDFHDNNAEEIVPPHVIVGRRVAGKMTSLSVCTGNGRTLKGRDLSDVRNAVLRMTGFLET